MTTNVKILIEALKNIQSYDHDGSGICPYGCDTPYIAKKALVDFGNAEYSSQQATQSKITGACPKCGMPREIHRCFGIKNGKKVPL